MIRDTQATWAALKAAQREAGSEIPGSPNALSFDGVTSEHLLLGLLIDAGELVARTLRQHRITVEDVRRALPEKPPEAGGDEARQIYARAQAEASALEHVKVEPGHLFLAIARDPACAGHQVLCDLGADVDEVGEEVAERLPTIVRDEAFYRQLVELYPRLPRQEVQQLLRDVLAWRAANTALRDQPGLGPDEERQLRQVLEETRSAWLTLVQHHNHLVFEQVLPYAAEGHNLEYVSWVAAGAVNALVLNEHPAADADFEKLARRRIATELEDRFA